MAEIIGCVSGAIALTQVVTSISKVMIKLNQQWSMVELPDWLCKIAWGLRCSKAMGAWAYTLHPYIIRPPESEVFRVAGFGSSISLLKLFTNGEASPYDKTPDGSTLIHIAAREFNTDTFQFLMRIEHQPLEPDNKGFYPLAKTLELERSHENAQPFLQTLMSDHRVLRKYLMVSGIDESTWIKSRAPHSRAISSTDFASVALKDMAGIWASRWYIPKILEPTLIDDEDCSWERSALATAAPLIDWVFGPDTRRVTAFTRMLVAMLHCMNHSRTDQWWEAYFRGNIGVWLETLKENGIDLAEYGRRELEILHREEANRDWYAPAMLPRNLDQEYTYYGAVFRLVGFQYGPNPEDWKIYVSEATDMFAGEFWEMVENPLPTVPGSWVVGC
ncbi:hypothetical protein F5Y14DRAFT_454037 [Nemania sp. NC0429]|nr:hypothetical protein F5Y14DRAFT_454037 [Nemania sp. NC0429]